MEHRTLSPGEKPFEALSDFNVLASCIGAQACLQVLENLIQVGATPTNVAQQTGLMRLAVSNARDELDRRGIPAPELHVTAVTQRL